MAARRNTNRYSALSCPARSDGTELTLIAASGSLSFSVSNTTITIVGADNVDAFLALLPELQAEIEFQRSVAANP